MDAHPETHLVATAAYFIDDRGVRVGLCPALRGTCELKISMALYNPIIHSSVMFRADTARELNGYSEDELTAQRGLRALATDCPLRKDNHSFRAAG